MGLWVLAAFFGLIIFWVKADRTDYRSYGGLRPSWRRSYRTKRWRIGR
jgi:hypothetical protein